MLAALLELETEAPTHPNEFDLKRIGRTLEMRQRYRYVVPSVFGVVGGYRVEAPCCSRNIDPDGGQVEIALMLFDDKHGAWRLFAKDHERKSWEFHSMHRRLMEALACLNEDRERGFWQ